MPPPSAKSLHKNKAKHGSHLSGPPPPRAGLNEGSHSGDLITEPVSIPAASSLAQHLVLHSLEEPWEASTSFSLVLTEKQRRILSPGGTKQITHFQSRRKLAQVLHGRPSAFLKRSRFHCLLSHLLALWPQQGIQHLRAPHFSSSKPGDHAPEAPTNNLSHSLWPSREPRGFNDIQQPLGLSLMLVRNTKYLILKPSLFKVSQRVGPWEVGGSQAKNNYPHAL